MKNSDTSPHPPGEAQLNSVDHAESEALKALLAKGRSSSETPGEEEQLLRYDSRTLLVNTAFLDLALVSVIARAEHRQDKPGYAKLAKSSRPARRAAIQRLRTDGQSPDEIRELLGPPEKRIGAADALLALKIVAFLTFQSRKRRAFPGAEFIANEFAARALPGTKAPSVGMVKAAIRFLAKVGVTRGKGARGTWNIPLPSSVEQLQDGETFVMLPEAALGLDPFSLAILAFMHKTLQGSVVEDFRRNKTIPRTGPVFLNGATLRIFGSEAVRAACQRLEAEQFIERYPTSIVVTPNAAQKAADEKHHRGEGGTASPFTAMRERSKRRRARATEARRARKADSR
jgi:hypothetical protein